MDFRPTPKRANHHAKAFMGKALTLTHRWFSQIGILTALSNPSIILPNREEKICDSSDVKS